MQDDPPEIERRLFFTGGFLAYLIMGASFVERCIGETALGVRTKGRTPTSSCGKTLGSNGSWTYLYVLQKQLNNNPSDLALAINNP